MNKSYQLGTIAEIINAELRGDATVEITGIAPLDKAASGQLSFLESARYRDCLPETKASAVILTAKHAEQCPTNALLVADPYVAYAKISALFNNLPAVQHGIHPSAVINGGCKIPSSACVGAHCVIGRNVTLGERVVLEPGCVIGDEVVIGADSHLFANVSIYYQTQLGERVIIHSGAVIGADGFGMANDKGIWRKIIQIGRVIIGNDVEIGANTSIDRGALEDTIIEDGVKLDNQIQVGHNVRIGAHTAIAGCVAIAGSTKIGRHCMIGGMSCINGHIEIADQVMITGGTAVGKSIAKPGVYSSGWPATSHRKWWRIVKRLMKVEDLVKKVNSLEK